MQFLQATFSPLVLIFTVANLAAMGFQVRAPEVAAALRSPARVRQISAMKKAIADRLGDPNHGFSG
jgi:hypothetical protein